MKGRKTTAGRILLAGALAAVLFLPALLSPSGASAQCGVFEEGFDDFNLGVRPDGWSFIGCGANSDVYTSTGNFGLDSPSLRLDDTGDSFTTHEFDLAGTLSFWMRGMGTAGDWEDSSLEIEEFISDDWFLLTEIIPISRSATTIGPLDLDPDTSRLRFTYHKVAGNLALDDICVDNLKTPTPIPTATPEGYKTPLPTPPPSPTPDCGRFFEEFHNFQEGTRPLGWSFVGIDSADVYTSTGFYGLAPPAVKMDTYGDIIQTSSFSYPGALHFWLRGAGTSPDGYLAVQQWYQDPLETDPRWHTLTNVFNIHTGFGGVTMGPFEPELTATRIRFVYQRHVGNIAIDDICLSHRPTPTPTPSATPTLTPTPSVTPTLTPTPTKVPTATPEPTNTPTPTAAPPTSTPTITPIPTASPTVTPSPTATSLATPTPVCVGDEDEIHEVDFEDWPNIAQGDWQFTDPSGLTWSAHEAYVNRMGGRPKVSMRSVDAWFEFPPVNYPGEVTFNMFLMNPNADPWDEALALEWIDPELPPEDPNYGEWQMLTEITTTSTHHEHTVVTYPVFLCDEMCVQFRVRVSRRRRQTISVDYITVSSDLCPTPTPSPTASPTSTPTPVETRTPTPSPSVTPTRTPLATRTPTPSVTPTPVETRTPTPSPSVTPTPTPSITPSVTPTPIQTRTPTPSATPTPTVTPTPSAIPWTRLLVDQVHGSTDLHYVLLYNPTMSDVRLGTDSVFLHSQSAVDRGESRLFRSPPDIIPKQGYFLVATERYLTPTGSFTEVTADAVVPLRIVQSSGAGHSWARLARVVEPELETIDALGWKATVATTDPHHYEGSPKIGRLFADTAWFRNQYGETGVRVDDDWNPTDFSSQSEIAPDGSGRITEWFCQTLWPVQDLYTPTADYAQQWSPTTTAGYTHFYELVGPQKGEGGPGDPGDLDFALLSYGDDKVSCGGVPGEATWFRLGAFPGDPDAGHISDFVDYWSRVHVELVIHGQQVGGTESTAVLRSGGRNFRRNFRFPNEVGEVDRLRPWPEDPSTDEDWTFTALRNLEVGIYNNNPGIPKYLTQVYARVWYTGSIPPVTPTPHTPAPTRTPSITPSPSITPTPTPEGYMTPTPSVTPSVTPTPSPVPTETPTPTPYGFKSPTVTPSVTPTVTPSPAPSASPFEKGPSLTFPAAESWSYLMSSVTWSSLGEYKSSTVPESTLKIWDTAGQPSTIGSWREESPWVHGGGWAYTINLPIFWDKDRDRDGMPIFWELQWEDELGLSDLNPDDAVIDYDGDGFTAIQEYLAKTDPTDSASFLQFTDIRLVTAEGIPQLWARTPTVLVQGMHAEYPNYLRSLSYEILYADWSREDQKAGADFFKENPDWFNLTGTWTVLTGDGGELVRFSRQADLTQYVENLAGLESLNEGDIRFYRLAIGGTWDQGEPVPHEQLSADWAYYTQVGSWRLASTLAREILMVQKHRLSPDDPDYGFFSLAGNTAGSGGIFDHVLGTEYFYAGDVPADATNINLWLEQGKVAVDFLSDQGMWRAETQFPSERVITPEEGFRLRFKPEDDPVYPEEQPYFYLSAQLKTDDYYYEIPRHEGEGSLAWNDPNRRVSMIAYNLPFERAFLDLDFPRLAGEKIPRHQFHRWQFSDHVRLFNRDISSRFPGHTNATVGIYYYYPEGRWEYFTPVAMGTEVGDELKVSPGSPIIVHQFRDPDEAEDDWVIRDSLPWNPALTYLRMAVPEPDPESLPIEEGFDGFDEGVRPAGWLFTNLGNDDVFTGEGWFGNDSPALRMDDQARVETPVFESAAGVQLEFWIRGEGVQSTSALLVEEHDGVGWLEVTTIADLPTTETTLGPLGLGETASSVRFTYNRNMAGEEGFLAFDDVHIYQD